jgi:hypothetical protein
VVSTARNRPWLLPLLASLLVVVVGVGCGGRSDIHYLEDDPARMARLKQLLREEHIAFREVADGGIEYSWDVAERVTDVRDRMSRVVAIQLSEPSERAIAMKTLEGLGQQPREVLRPDGYWVEWYPESDFQSKVTDRRVWQALREADSRTGKPRDRGSNNATQGTKGAR